MMQAPPAVPPGRPDLARVFVLARAEMHPFFVELVKLLKARHGSVCFMHFRDAKLAEDFRRTPNAGLFDDIRGGNVLLETCFEPVPDDAAVLARARRLEAWLGTTINALLQTDRHFGRGFALGGLNHPRSRYSENTSYLQTVNAVCNMLEYWRDLFERLRPTLILNGDHYLEAVAQRLEIPIRLVAGSRYKNLCYWSPNGFFEAPDLERRTRAMPAAEALAFDQPYLAHLHMRRQTGQNPSLRRTLGRVARRLALHAYWHLRRFKKAKGYYLGSEVRFIWLRDRSLAYLAAPGRARLADLAGKRFVFFPLQTEPETSLQRLSPEFTAQLAAIAMLARELPADTLLAVKDTHFALGRRPAEFYRQIEEFKNVVLLNLHEYGLEVVRACDAVAVITGTPGFEGAVMGKPVIAFGRHNIFNFLDHVRAVRDPAELGAAIDWALARRFDEAKAKRDGAAFLRAVVDMSFDMAQYNYQSRTGLEPDSVEAGYRTLLDSLAAPALPQFRPLASAGE